MQQLSLSLCSCLDPAAVWVKSSSLSSLDEEQLIVSLKLDISSLVWACALRNNFEPWKNDTCPVHQQAFIFSNLKFARSNFICMPAQDKTDLFCYCYWLFFPGRCLNLNFTCSPTSSHSNCHKSCFFVAVVQPTDGDPSWFFVLSILVTFFDGDSLAGSAWAFVDDRMRFLFFLFSFQMTFTKRFEHENITLCLQPQVRE